MDSFNNTTWSTNSTFVQSVFNDTPDLTKNDVFHKEQHSVVLLSVFVLGLPGNILVIATYMGMMTTSTRVYMFALAWADAAICISAIVLTLASTHFVAAVMFLTIVITAITFSILLLVFVSIERLIAVRRPITFSMDPKRAKIVMIVFLLCATLFIIVDTLSKYMNYLKFDAILKATLLTGGALVMVTCYTLIGVTLFRKVMSSRNQIADISLEPSNQKSNPSKSNVNLTTVNSSEVQSTSARTVTKIMAKQTKNLKSIFLLFTVTVVFVACWLPLCLYEMGVRMSKDVVRIYVINSVVNPFIYGVASEMFREDVRQFYRRIKLSAC